MADDKKQVQRYYPSPDNYQNHQQWQDMRILYDHMHEVKEKGAEKAPVPTTKAGGPSNTKIAGLNVVGTPTNGQTLKYNSKTGQLEWS